MTTMCQLQTMLRVALARIDTRTDGYLVDRQTLDHFRTLLHHGNPTLTNPGADVPLPTQQHHQIPADDALSVRPNPDLPSRLGCDRVRYPYRYHALP
jgi:hypothetical protein